MPSYVRGLSVVRGAPVPVVDLVSLLGGNEPGDVTRFVTIRAGSRHVALAVPGILGVRALDETTAGSPLSLVEEGRSDPIQSIGALGGRLLMVLRAGRIIPERVWGDLVTAGSPP